MIERKSKIDIFDGERCYYWHAGPNCNTGELQRYLDLDRPDLAQAFRPSSGISTYLSQTYLKHLDLTQASRPSSARPSTWYFIPLQLPLSSHELDQCLSRSCELDVQHKIFVGESSELRELAISGQPSWGRAWYSRELGKLSPNSKPSSRELGTGSPRIALSKWIL
ncbi:hypothetical protein Acr_29g0007950 [Actinidia rufa]|uniref:Uncharacterized protein n=1 Tax=Actinidia rufa TaxID=165716 RepID=A0A7J0HEU5_9ERIC|nr:hypothetical protein Acr_29g0007950 [Actinidia rufa]